jgi:hypothetical protein
MAGEERPLLKKRADLSSGFETLKRKPHERSRSETGSRRSRGSEDVMRVNKNPEDGNV